MPNLGINLALGTGVLLAVLAGNALAQSSPAAAPAAPVTQQQPAAQATNTPGENGSAADGTSAPSSDDPLTTLRTTTNEVNVVFTVTDKRGHRVTDLKKNDFSIVDDNKAPAEIRSFSAETNLPLQVGLLIDASNSVRDRFKFEQESAIEFLNQTVHPSKDRAFVVGFDVTPEVTQDFTDNTELLAHGVHELRPGGGTAMYDALYFACRDKLLKLPRTLRSDAPSFSSAMVMTTRATSPVKKPSKWRSAPKPLSTPFPRT